MSHQVLLKNLRFFFSQNMFEGLIWFIMPIMMVVINDVMAYMFGFCFGKTPLIQLSPKKTWEGFIGGGVSFKILIDLSITHHIFPQVSTVMITLILSHYVCQYSSLVCPIGKNLLYKIRLLL